MFSLRVLVIIFMLCGFAVPAAASIGAGIGLSFPASSAVSGGRAENYAALTYDGLLEELTVREKSGGLKLELKITNQAAAPKTIEHRNGQFYDFVIWDKNGAALYRWSEGVSFTQALTATCYESNQAVVYLAEIPRKEYRQIKEEAVMVTAYLTDTPVTLSTRIPAAKSASSGATWHTGIILGNGRWADD